MKPLRNLTALAVAAAVALVPVSSAVAQRQATPDQRIDRLERQLRQIQRQVFPRGAPADTAGFSSEPAATQSSVTTLDQRLSSLEQQMANILRQAEENGHRLRTLESDAARARADQDQRIAALERRADEAAAAAAAAAAAPVVVEPAPTLPRPAATKPNKPAATRPNGTKPTTAKPTTTKPRADTAGSLAGPATAAADAAEEAYTEGFKLWEAGQYDEALSALRAFASAHPRHRRASYANNLIGRALLDKGQPREAAEALLANYRGNPKGERAPDSLFYLGQALMQLGQPGQACNVYAELESVYGANVRADLQRLVTDAKAQANCT